MNPKDSLSICLLDDQINNIFDLQRQISDKDFKIQRLEFELKLEREFMQIFKDYYFKLTTVVK